MASHWRPSGSAPPCHEEGVPEHDHALLVPEIEMPDPKLLVDHGHEGLDLDPAPLRDLEVEGAPDMQRFEVRQPGERPRCRPQNAPSTEIEISSSSSRSKDQSRNDARRSTTSTGCSARLGSMGRSDIQNSSCWVATRGGADSRPRATACEAFVRCRRINPRREGHDGHGRITVDVTIASRLARLNVGTTPAQATSVRITRIHLWRITAEAQCATLQKSCS